MELPRRCAQHDLACGPDGLCVMCRRAVAPAPSGGRVVGYGLAMLSACLAGAILWRGGGGIVEAIRASAAARAAADTAEAPASTVRLYTTSWCPHCAHAKQWLAAQHVDYVELDVEKNAWARREHRRLNPRGGVPTFDADGEVVTGFSPEAFQAALAHRGAPQKP